MSIESSRAKAYKRLSKRRRGNGRSSSISKGLRAGGPRQPSPSLATVRTISCCGLTGAQGWRNLLILGRKPTPKPWRGQPGVPPSSTLSRATTARVPLSLISRCRGPGRLVARGTSISGSLCSPHSPPSGFARFTKPRFSLRNLNERLPRSRLPIRARRRCSASGAV